MHPLKHAAIIVGIAWMVTGSLIPVNSDHSTAIAALAIILGFATLAAAGLWEAILQEQGDGH
ncbi:hypothetical protein [Arthrobacter sp. A2-55]|uniref:hypothetical protein n=1 Tax=Arthrobacter sp. A2-55 TaxID=2897337 RepID=UPI0021CD83B0|nr:hypothetical protein [Arthrobacter sp. A2-55]MCU6481326.1 hypothetical protein [Arthrobacter sp. A2-55]